MALQYLQHMTSYNFIDTKGKTRRNFGRSNKPNLIRSCFLDAVSLNFSPIFKCLNLQTRFKAWLWGRTFRFDMCEASWRWIMCVITTAFGTTEGLSRTSLQRPDWCLLNLRSVLNVRKRREEEKEGKETAFLVKKNKEKKWKNDLSVNQRFPRRAGVIASGQRERENEGL